MSTAAAFCTSAVPHIAFRSPLISIRRIGVVRRAAEKASSHRLIFSHRKQREEYRTWRGAYQFPVQGLA